MFSWLDSSSGLTKNKCGGKACSLNSLLCAGFNVPRGFVLHVDAFLAFLDYNNIKITNLSRDCDEYLLNLQSKIMQGTFNPTLYEGIKRHYDLFDCKKLVIRSSSITEDSDTTSYAGQFSSCLNVCTLEAVLKSIKKCWASYYGTAAHSYRCKVDDDHVPAISVIVQKLIDADKSGVAFSINPITNVDEEIVIESTYGHCEAVVSGNINPDMDVVSKSNLEKLVRSKGTKKKMVLLDPDGGTKWVEIPTELSSNHVLTLDEIKSICESVINIEHHYGHPVDVEWVICDDVLYVVQSRPVTTI